MGIVWIYEVIYHMIFISGFHLNDFWKSNECPLDLCLFIIPSIDEKKRFWMIYCQNISGGI